MANRFYDFPGDKRSYVSVTTFLNIIGKQEYLMPWAAKMERELIRELVNQGHDIDYILDFIRMPTKTDKGEPYGFQLSNEVASDFGNKIHKAIDYTLKDLKLPRMSKDERKVYDKWLEWWKAQGFELLGAEQVIRHDRLGYAGTLDARVRKNGKVLILDWKTGKNHYDEHDLQNLAYQLALPEAGGGQLVYIRPDKEVDDSHKIPQVDEENIQPVLDALGLWRWNNKKPWKENI